MLTVRILSMPLGIYVCRCQERVYCTVCIEHEAPIQFNQYSVEMVLVTHVLYVVYKWPWKCVRYKAFIELLCQ